MVDKIPPRGESEENNNFITLSNDTISDVQRGHFKQPSFYGDQSSSSNHSSFKSGVNTSEGYSGFSLQFREDGDHELTPTEIKELEKVARNIASYGNVPYDVAEDFLYILIAIDDIEDMRKISIATEIEELDDESILQNAMVILSIRSLIKVAYLANALSGLIKAFAKYKRANNKATSSGTSGLSFIGAALSLFGISGSSATALLDKGPTQDRLGHYLSEVVLGTRIPTPVIASNPMKESPSYAGKVFFGEASSPMALNDIDELFPKKIGVYESPDKGSGLSSFNFQNIGTLQGTQSITDMINIFSIGKKTEDITENTYIAEKSEENKTKALDLMGASETDTLELNRADNAIPFMIALSAINCNTDSCPFSYQTFQEAWILSNSVNNFLQEEQNDFIETIRKLT